MKKSIYSLEHVIRIGRAAIHRYLDFLSKIDIAVVAQVLSNSISHSLLKRRGYNEVRGVFSKEYLFMMGNLELVRNHYLK